MATSPSFSVSSSGSMMTSSSSRLPNPQLNFVGSSSTSSSQTGPFNFAPLITTKLGPNNYLYWRAQVATILRSHLLTGFVDGSFPCPPEFVDNPKAAEDTAAPRTLHNPAFTAWQQQDAALLSSIIATSTESIQGMVLFAASAQDAWTTLASSFSSQSSARYMQLRREIGEVQKLDLSVTAYFNKVKSMSDTLTSIGQPLRPEELVSCILNGLNDEFDALIEVVNARTTPIPLRDLFAQMLSTEQRVERRKAVLCSGHGDFSSANASYRGGGNGGRLPYRPDYRSGGDQRGPRPGYIAKPASSGSTSGGSNDTRQGDHGGDRGNRGDLERTRSSGARGGNRLICQICDKQGHKASSCFKRFKQDYL
uniref:Uncharacterized protein n=1 Tax=Avena sativa TaxID=4498 RepID=A0ACD5UQ02_AVESA